MTTQMIDKSNFDNKQYKADLQCAYDSGYVKGQVDILKKTKAEIRKMRSKQNCSCSDCLDILDNHIKELKGENK